MNKQLKKSLDSVNLHQKSAPTAGKRAKFMQSPKSLKSDKSYKSPKLNRGLEPNSKVDLNTQTNMSYEERGAQRQNEMIDLNRHGSTTAIHRSADQDALFLYQLIFDKALDPEFARLKEMLDAGLNLSQCFKDPLVDFIGLEKVQQDRFFYALISHSKGRALGEFLLNYHEKNLHELKFFKTNMEKMPQLMVIENSLKRIHLFELIISKGNFSNEDVLEDVSVYDNYNYFLEKNNAMIEKCMLTEGVPLTEIKIKTLKI